MGEGCIATPILKPELDFLFWLDGDRVLFAGDFSLLDLDDPARTTPGILPEGVRERTRLGVPILAMEPLLMNVDPGRLPNFGNAN